MRATMVTAGVYMTARLHFLFALAPATLALIAVIGAATAFFAATIALTQNDIKKVLAYSTVSQLGYMFLALGVGVQRGDLSCLHPRVFQVLLIPWFGQRDSRHGRRARHAQDGRAQGLHADDLLDLCDRHAGDRRCAVYRRLFFQGFNSLAGVQPRRDRSMGVGLITAGMTAFYMFRQLIMVFHGDCRADDHAKAHLHESPAGMTLPLIVLAIGSIFTGWLGAPEYLLGELLGSLVGAAVRRRGGASWLRQTEVTVTLITLGVAAAGIISPS